jgi:hypothetical protein
MTIASSTSSTSASVIRCTCVHNRSENRPRSFVEEIRKRPVLLTRALIRSFSASSADVNLAYGGLTADHERRGFEKCAA